MGNNQYKKMNRQIERWSWLASYLVGENRTEEALSYFNKILDLDPLNSHAMDNKIYALEELRRPEEALRCIDGYLRYKPSDALIWIHKGNLLDGHYHDYMKAIDCFNWAIQIDEKNVTARIDKAYLLKNNGDYANAAKCFQEVMKLLAQDQNIKYEVERDCYFEFAEEYKDCLILMGK